MPLLEAKGHVVSAPDLPGHGEDRTPIHQVTLDSYVQRIGEVLERHEEPAVLVGTSMGGMVTQPTPGAKQSEGLAAKKTRYGQLIFPIVSRHPIFFVYSFWLFP